MVHSPQVNSRNIILSSDGMHEMAERIGTLLAERTDSFSCLQAACVQFANGELKPSIPETVRGTHVFLLAALQEPDPNTAFMKMLLTADALKRASVLGITLVVPYIPYLRQDRKDAPRVPISARLIADMIEINKKIERVITLDMHADQEQGFFSIPVDNINGSAVHAEQCLNRFGNRLEPVVALAPDFGSAVRTRRFARKLGDVPVSIIEKNRPAPNESEIVSIIGPSLSGRDVVIYDDMIDKGGTTLGAIAESYRQGAQSVTAYVTHGIFSQQSEEKFATARCMIFSLPTIPRTAEYMARHASWLTYVSIDELLADAIYEASLVGGSISKLSN